MRIVVDIQGSIYNASFANSYPNALSIAKAMARYVCEDDLILTLTGDCSDTLKGIRGAFSGVLPAENIRVWCGSASHALTYQSAWHRKVAEHIRAAFLENLRPDLLLMLCLSSDCNEEAAASVGLMASRVKTVVALNSLPAMIGHGLLEPLRKAGCLIAMPPLTADELARHFDMSPGGIRALPFAPGVKSVSSQEIATGLLDAARGLLFASSHDQQSILASRKRLAYVSPLPPVRSGIADYSAELLYELTRYYEVDVIVDQDDIEMTSLGNCTARKFDWFMTNADAYDRVLYHIGNSSYHQKMFEASRCCPGVVVLHDFFLGDAYYSCQNDLVTPHAWTRALFASHGYGALIECQNKRDIEGTVRKYPANRQILEEARGVIVHSQHAKSLSAEWYGNALGLDWQVIPLLRNPRPLGVRAEIRARLGLPENAFLVCSFGLIGSTKLNHRLLESWKISQLKEDPSCHLVFVGENPGGEYGDRLTKSIAALDHCGRVRITGWADTERYQDYLQAADVAVQLRTQSRGETSAAVLDAMSVGLPTIVNAHGSMAELIPDSVWLLKDQFIDRELVEALQILWKNPNIRTSLSKNGETAVRRLHAPYACAERYVNAIERFYERGNHDCCEKRLVESIASFGGYTPSDAECFEIAECIACATPPQKKARQFLIDVSATCHHDLKTGIQRVVRALVRELILAPPPDHRVEPVYLTNEGGVWHYRYARRWVCAVFDLPESSVPLDGPVDYMPGDHMILADLAVGQVDAALRTGLYRKVATAGVQLHFVLYDLIPIHMPHVFPPEELGFSQWLTTLSESANSVLCISRAVAKDFSAWMESHPLMTKVPPKINWFHLGADISNSLPSLGLTQDSERILAGLGNSTSFLMVGTIEPRKGYLQVLDAFNILWQGGLDIKLVIVGAEGWKGLPDEERRTIPETVARIRNHQEFGTRLLWLEGISDEYLARVYATSTCLLAASEAEGFGLPLIEAAQNGLPIIARDIPVFREVAGEHAYYFDNAGCESISSAIKKWLALYRSGNAPSSAGLQWQTWEQSAKQVVHAIFNDDKHDEGEN